MSVVHIEKGDAEAALKAASVEDGERRIVHCFLGFVGADWDVEHAMATLAEATEVAWASNLLGHDLAIRSPEGKVYRFGVRAPDGVLS